MTFRSDRGDADRGGCPAVPGRTRRARTRLVPWLLCAVGLLPLPALAWGWPTHRLIAELAETRSSMSTWADEFRSPTTASWH